MEGNQPYMGTITLTTMTSSSSEDDDDEDMVVASRLDTSQTTLGNFNQLSLHYCVVFSKNTF
jgi:hypothetical protein